MSPNFATNISDNVASLVPRMLPVMTADALSQSTCYLRSSGDYYCEHCITPWGFRTTSTCYTFDG